MKRYTTLTLAFVVCVFSIALPETHAQKGPSRQELEQLRRMKDDNKQRTQTTTPLSNIIPRRRRNEGPRVSKYEKARLNAVSAEIQPDPKDVNRYSRLLSKSNTGIFRLLPAMDCKDGFKVRTDGECANYNSDFRFYSFRLPGFVYETYRDISFKNGAFVSDGILSQGLFVKLGSGFINTATTANPCLKRLIDFVPGKNRQAARAQFSEISSGLDNGGCVYSSEIEVEIGKTYGFRVVAYRFDDKWKKRPDHLNDGSLSDKERYAAYEIDRLDFDRRIDATYLFEVVRKGTDGGITIVWKRISKNKSPKLTFQVKEKLSDFRGSWEKNIHR